MQNKIKLNILYHPGTWGNCLKWMLERFSGNPTLQGIISPWDQDNRVHGFPGTWGPRLNHDGPMLSGEITAIHPYEDVRWRRIPPETPHVVIDYDTADQLFVERCTFYRHVGQEKHEDRHKHLLYEVDKDFLKQCFGSKTKDSESVAKELFKIRLHDAENFAPWLAMLSWIRNDKHHHFPINAFFDGDLLTQELIKISERFDLSLDIDQKVISNVVTKTTTATPVVTRHRARQVLDAIEQRRSMECGDLDLLEQAFVEVILEKRMDSVIFPYGTAWFKDTDKINEFLDTYPSYLKHMNPRLKWYNGNKNPFYLTGKIDTPKGGS